MPVLRLQPAVWLPRHAIHMNKDYMYYGPGALPRRVKVVGYSSCSRGNGAMFFCADICAAGTVLVGENARSEWVSPWFKALGYMPIDWIKYTGMKLKLRLSERVEGSHRG